MKIVILLFVFILNYVTVNCKPHIRDYRRAHSYDGRTKREIVTHGTAGRELDANFWHDGARNALKAKLLVKPNTNIAKNVILFMGDGMSIPSLAAVRAYVSQKRGYGADESNLSFEKFPYTGLAKTYCVDHQVADSACASVAYLCGVKANMGTLGVSARVANGNCEAMRNTSNHVDSILSWGQKAGKATGLITTTRITHASPGGSYAHTADREWECDADVLRYKQDPQRCMDIAQQLVTQAPGNKLKVIFGGGRKKLLPENFTDSEGHNGQRKDGLNLIAKWQQDKAKQGLNAKYVHDRQGLLGLDLSTTDSVMGLFESDHMQYNLEMDRETEPTLAEMTRTAIRLLGKDNNGFVLFVEGGRIDHAHHDNLVKKALDETEQMAEAVSAALELTSDDDTMIVVTSDHSHVMTMSGYAPRGSDILGFARLSHVDKLPYTILSYSNGPGYRHPSENGTRYDQSKDNTRDNNYRSPAMVPLDSETHGGEDVAVFCSGPWSHLCTGVYEQTLVPHIMAFANCMGEGATACKH